MANWISLYFCGSGEGGSGNRHRGDGDLAGLRSGWNGRGDLTFGGMASTFTVNSANQRRDRRQQDQRNRELITEEADEDR